MAFAKRLQHIPTPIGGVALAIGSLMNCWQANHISLPSPIASLLWLTIALAILLVISKYVMNPGSLRADLSCPAIGSVIPTSAMATMVLSTALAPHQLQLAQWLWSIAVITHLLLLVGFIWQQKSQLKLERVLPSWFVPPVGIGVAAVTAPAVALIPQGIWALKLALISYLMLLPFVVYRILFAERLPEQNWPTLAIMAAPANLCLAGAMQLYSTPTDSWLLLLGLALGMSALVVLALFRLLRLTFSPGMAALTFPLVISAFGQHLAAGKLLAGSHWASTLHHLAFCELLLATLVTSYVALRYLLLLKPF